MKALRFVPTGIHAYFDYIGGIVLLAAPFIFGFISKTPNVYLPHIIAGVGVILLVLVTQTQYQPKKAEAFA